MLNKEEYFEVSQVDINKENISKLSNNMNEKNSIDNASNIAELKNKLDNLTNEYNETKKNVNVNTNTINDDILPVMEEIKKLKNQLDNQ